MKDYYSDEELLALMNSQAGQKIAFTYIFLNGVFRNKAFAIMFRLGVEKEVAEEIYRYAIGSFFTTVARNNFKKGSSILTYLVSACKKLSFKHFKEKGKTLLIKEGTQEFLRRRSLEDSNEFTFFVEEEVRYETALKQKIYRQLPKKCQEYFRLRYRKGYKQKEVAKMLDRSVSAMKSREKECREHLRETIKTDPEALAQIKKYYGK